MTSKIPQPQSLPITFDSSIEHIINIYKCELVESLNYWISQSQSLSTCISQLAFKYLDPEKEAYTIYVVIQTD